MNLVFTKGAQRTDRLEVRRPGRAPELIECPKQGIIPHDMVHYAVEHTLHRRGFLSRVADGEAAVFQMSSEAESDGVERLVEVIQGDAWSGGAGAAGDLLAMYELTCVAKQCPALPVSEVDIDAIRGHIAELSTRWAQVGVGQSLELEF
jgi:hypothetical protein